MGNQTFCSVISKLGQQISAKKNEELSIETRHTCGAKTDTVYV